MLAIDVAACIIALPLLLIAARLFVKPAPRPLRAQPIQLTHWASAVHSRRADEAARRRP